MDEAEKWLKQNDPNYKNYKNRRNMEYPYLTARQEFLRSRKEIPVSCLDTHLAQEWTGMDEQDLKRVKDALL